MSFVSILGSPLILVSFSAQHFSTCGYPAAEFDDYSGVQHKLLKFVIVPNRLLPDSEKTGAYTWHL